MYTHFFGNYLLSNDIISREQLLSAMESQSSARVKLGTLAVHAGYMTPDQTEEIFIIQTHQDKRFGELAIAAGYLTDGQVQELLSQQVPDFISLGQILVDQGALSPTELDQHIAAYQKQYAIHGLASDQEQNALVQGLILNSSLPLEAKQNEYLSQYLLLLFNNLIRFIGNDFTPINILSVNEFDTDFCVVQNLGNDALKLNSALNTDKATALQFASRYAKDEFTEFDEYVQASMDDFLNLHNGLFAVNMSNNSSLELTLEPPFSRSQDTLTSPTGVYLVQILYSFGMVHFIFSFS